MREDHFPAEFVWGIATASYQVEGAVREAGRGESIWDRFCATAGKVRNGDSGEIACDHYHRYPEDVALMSRLGVNAYRFSVAWPRVFPAGGGRPNQLGLDFYDRLVDALLEANIEPFLTLYHWDLPQSLEDQGGWTNRATADAFERYAATVVERLGDRVRYWITHNEPWCTAWLGYGYGVHAPGRTGERNALAAAHHVLLSHGRAVDVIRRHRSDAEVGITLNLYPVYPASEDARDREAVRNQDGRRNRWFLDPIFRGAYPADMAEVFGHYMPSILAGDLQTIAAPLDFVGVNYYTRDVMRAEHDGHAGYARPEGARYTDMGWEVFPDGLGDLLQRLHRDYRPKSIYITENGAAYPDVRTHDGAVRDPERQQYIEQHLRAAQLAIKEGVPLRGYFVWSLLDNFEWAHGYSRRFGLVYVDYPTLERVPKGSFELYRSFIVEQASRNGAVPVPSHTRAGRGRRD